ncbi:protein NEOXANTHIN-DEFICIENT 1 isoform X2 [Cornus florida]|uniref:protein NEOXANTHIN-DEFICIENT 1 isoform X2 n=1 Tax=Cornus florida TaxID=4283 RepID=UPI0028A143D9|nr:protein NEOXANTHIN-DEFICIENT 1 isoform X2 [Cornus florida]
MEVKETTTEVKETKSCSGYEKPPWVFKGSALYQLHLVKSETARAFIPKEFRLVEAFGYTLGGFFLASYDDSPAGSFEELVVMAGIVWNPPTSCGWAARVLVNSDEACFHGRKDVGLPSQVAKFSKRITEIPRQSNSKINGLLNMIGLGSTVSSPKNCKNVQVSEIKGPVATDICAINLGIAVPEQNPNKFLGPVIKMSLPSFSGRTEYNSNLLKYSCQIECRMRPVHPAKVLGPSLIPKNDAEQSSEWQNSDFMDPTTREVGEKERNLSISVMLSKPILALEFNCLKMQDSQRTDPSLNCACYSYI